MARSVRESNGDALSARQAEYRRMWKLVEAARFGETVTTFAADPERLIPKLEKGLRTGRRIREPKLPPDTVI